MTRDDIIRMAREAGWHDELLNVSFTAPLLERFAALVAAAAAAAEREACAQVCDGVRAEADELVRPNLSQEAFWGYAVATLDCAKAIRARGEA